jgi:hypothetical protein
MSGRSAAFDGALLWRPTGIAAIQRLGNARPEEFAMEMRLEKRAA